MHVTIIFAGARLGLGKQQSDLAYLTAVSQPQSWSQAGPACNYAGTSYITGRIQGVAVFIHTLGFPVKAEAKGSQASLMLGWENFRGTGVIHYIHTEERPGKYLGAG